MEVKHFVPLLLLLFLTAMGCSNSEELEPADEDWSFVVFGDVGQRLGIYGELAETIGQIQPVPQLALFLGDAMKKNGNELEWAIFQDQSRPITDRMPLYFVRGNHEGNDASAEKIFRQQAGIATEHFYYRFQVRNSLFLVLDSFEKGEEENIGPVQRDWLANQLEIASASPAIRNVFVFVHHPLFDPPDGDEARMKSAGELHRLFTGNGKVRAVFSGHIHQFRHFVKDQVVYIITGGGGSPFFSNQANYHHITKVSFHEESNRINIQTIGLFKEVVESFDL